MSETTNVVQEDKEQDIEAIIAKSPFAKPVVITRNGVSETLKVSVGKRGAWENRPYGHPQIETDGAQDYEKDHTFHKVLKWIGKDNVKNFLNTILRRVGQDYVDDAISETTGEFSMASFLKSWENLAAAGLKLAELKELLDLEQRKFEAYITSDAFFTLASNKETKDQAKHQSDTMGNSIKALRFELAQRASRRSKEIATETVAPE